MKVRELLAELAECDLDENVYIHIYHKSARTNNITGDTLLPINAVTLEGDDNVPYIQATMVFLKS